MRAEHVIESAESLLRSARSLNLSPAEAAAALALAVGRLARSSALSTERLGELMAATSDVEALEQVATFGRECRGYDA